MRVHKRISLPQTSLFLPFLSMLNLLVYSYMIVLNAVLLLSSERVTKMRLFKEIIEDNRIVNLSVCEASMALSYQI